MPVIVTTQHVDPPEERDDAKGIKGRKSWRVKDTSGLSYFIPADKGNGQQDLNIQLEVGKTYALETKAGAHNLTWINSAALEGTSSHTPVEDIPFEIDEPTPRSEKTWAKPEDKRTRSIVSQSIIKSCAERNGSTEQANMWMAWHDAQVEGVEMQGAVDSVLAVFHDAQRTGFTVNVQAKASVDLETSDFQINEALWDNHTTEIIKLIDTTMSSMSFSKPEEVQSWFKRQANVFAPLKERDPETFATIKNRAKALKEDLVSDGPEEEDDI
tara:strand:- start:1508 stop:2317 length:810 start_codon:yes stop_codon:yes gene_type:complete